MDTLERSSLHRLALKEPVESDALLLFRAKSRLFFSSKEKPATPNYLSGGFPESPAGPVSLLTGNKPEWASFHNIPTTINGSRRSISMRIYS